jgi:hypothetical protein
MSSALWRRLDTPGHDAALVTRSETGWSLRGTAVFAHADGPACIQYAVDLDGAWRTTSGRVHGFVAARAIDYRIRREPTGWYLNDVAIAGLDHLWDLDYGFTPATNMQQLRRVAIARGQAADIPVVWFDVDEPTLIELPQRYERRGETTYWYESPTASYEALLEIADNGFVASYPRLWSIER